MNKSKLVKKSNCLPFSPCLVCLLCWSEKSTLAKKWLFLLLFSTSLLTLNCDITLRLISGPNVSKYLRKLSKFSSNNKQHVQNGSIWSETCDLLIASSALEPLYHFEKLGNNIIFLQFTSSDWRTETISLQADVFIS